MADNFTAEELAAFTPEQRTEIERIEQSVRDFLADSRTIRYVESDANRDALLNFLTDHGLEVSHANLVFSYGSLADVLELIPLAPVVERPPAPTTQPAPIPTAPSRPGPRAVAWRNGKVIELTNPRPL